MRHKCPSVIRVLIIGCGDVGLRTAQNFLPHYRVYGLVRSTDKVHRLRAAGVIPIVADLAKRDSLTRIAAIADVVLHFAPPPGEGQVDTHTRNLLAVLARRTKLPQRLVYISTSGVYGDCAGDWVSESRTPHPTTARAIRRVEAEAQVRRFGRSACVSVRILRVPGIYAAERLPQARIERGTPVLCAADDVYTNHIHADDLAHMVKLAMFRGGNARIYHACDDSELKMGEYFNLVARALDLPEPAKISRQQAQQLLPANLLSFMSESRRLLNTRMKLELRLQLRYPTAGSFLEEYRTGMQSCNG
ncbi:MAG: SDR family oxidoreductase [Sulfuriferula sp.]